ncbi:uncharacterized protein EKO05_0003949 [Ascochyta rabiei]|uniref:Uncharacterized protein n=1 Tax=Didymella rabiei TaxID=5454 RepID=A0A163DZ09_DIDRA|nr:uncharacterized protein EKO05_0003949 [Ascochyta rabiei]KZM23422.1 hypothetical protein ST47_g5439 [Ascochyta rabiei]UPX13441.1 hypothetical protein EKO05_0003949 [Ascochyta rabiei]
MADGPQPDNLTDASEPREASTKTPSPFPPPAPSYSRWRTSAHLYLPLVTVFLLMSLGTPFETPGANFLCVFLSAIPTNWLGAFFYPTDRAEPKPEQAIRFTRKSNICRAAVLVTYRWMFGRSFDLFMLTADFFLSHFIGPLIGERPPGTKERRSEFGVALLWMAGSGMLMQYAPSALSYWIIVADRTVWRAVYMAFVDDVVGVLARPNLKTWRGKVTLVLTQAFTITFISWMLLSWTRDAMLAAGVDDERKAALAAMEAQLNSMKAEGDIEDDGDRYLV